MQPFFHFLVTWIVFPQSHTVWHWDPLSGISSDHLGRFGEFVRGGKKQLSSSLLAWEPGTKQEVLADTQLSEASSVSRKFSALGSWEALFSVHMSSTSQNKNKTWWRNLTKINKRIVSAILSGVCAKLTGRAVTTRRAFQQRLVQGALSLCSGVPNKWHTPGDNRWLCSVSLKFYLLNSLKSVSCTVATLLVQSTSPGRPKEGIHKKEKQERSAKEGFSQKKCLSPWLAVSTL